MACRFLENLTLKTLVAPVPVDEFRARYWEQQPLIVNRNDRDYYDDLFTLRDFDEAMARTPEYIKMANYVTDKHAKYKSEASRGVESALADMRDGGTLVLDQLHHHEPKLGLLCRKLAPELGHRFQCNLYLTPPHGKGFSPHWDNHDVFILQVFGSKHWKVEKERRCLPLKEEKMGDEGRELRGELHTTTIEQGDVIYIPRGFIHAAECGAEPSLHITFGVSAVFWDDLLGAVLRAAALRDQRLRQALPFGFMNGGREALVNRVKGIFREISDETFLSGAVDQFLDELVPRYQLDVAGQIAEFFHPKPITLDEVVGPRAAIVYRMHVADDSVRLNYGGRTITFGGFFREGLDFALTTSAYAVRDIPGELQDEERIVFIERLIQEGLVVRKTKSAT
jgi:ribosomal protein L16 Arg81 hydroxylase